MAVETILPAFAVFLCFFGELVSSTGRSSRNVEVLVLVQYALDR